MDDFELPPPPEQTVTRSRPSLLTRKRTRDEFSEEVPTSAASSDPALFSGDEQVPGAEDYAVQRKKKLYSGSWFNHRTKANKEDRKREFKRNFDSGIFMGSESSDIPSSDSLGSLDEELIEDERKKETAATSQRLFPSSSSQHSSRTTRLPVKPAAPVMSEKHAAVMNIVHKSLEEAQVMIDLSGLNLESLPSEFMSLSTLSRPAGLASGMLEHGQSFEPHLLMYLSNNLFTTVPREILNLTNIAELSLRNNQLTHLPPGIRQLVNLRELNICHNQLTYLPFEVRELVHNHSLRAVRSEGNPWIMPAEGTPNLPPKSLLPWPQLSVRQQVRSGFSIGTLNAPKSNVPSLMESTLRALLRFDENIDFRRYVPADAPGPIFDALKSLDDWRVVGGLRCSSCDRAIVQEAFQQLEWWATACNGKISTRLPMLPFMRTFCNKECAQEGEIPFKKGQHIGRPPVVLIESSDSETEI
jgi:hypothetical protein